jgi:hypothetical protein
MKHFIQRSFYNAESHNAGFGAAEKPPAGSQA